MNTIQVGSVKSSSDQDKRFMFTYLQRLIEFGVPQPEAAKVAKAVTRYRLAKQAKRERRAAKAQLMTPIYWRRLTDAGVPSQVAYEIAEIIARYDVARKLPNAEQRNLISQHCRFICRAELWRSQLLSS